MAYTKRDWETTGNEVTKEDFKRIENGIEDVDLDLSNQKNPTIPGTLAKQIADMKDQSIEGSLANQISSNAKQINVLNNDRGYLSSKGSTFNLATKNGKYIVSNDINCPDGSINSTWLVNVTQMNDAYVLQEAFCLYSELGNTGQHFHRMSSNNIWSSWEQSNSTIKSSLILQNNWQLESGLNIITKTGSRCSTILTVKGGDYSGQITVAQIPEGFRPLVYTINPTTYGYSRINTDAIIQTDGQIIIGSIKNNERLYLNLEWDC